MSANGVTATISEAVNGAVNGAKSAVDHIEYTVPLIINGKEVNTSTTFDVIAPSTGKVIHKCSSASVSDAIQAVEAAQAAFPAWRDTPPAKKRDIFLKAAEIAQSRAVELGKYMEDETGAGAGWAAGFNVPLAIDGLKDVAGRISSIKGSIPTPGDPGTSALVFNEPYGVILGIAPWNAAYILGFRSITYAIAAGNTAILKAPEFSPRCSWAIGSVFKEAGLPDGVLNVIAHQPKDAAAVTKALIEHPSVKKINFTGSTVVGKIIAEIAGKNLKPVLLELGGKAPAIVLEDADLELAAKECTVGAFLHSGQICMSTERIIVHKSVSKDFQAHYKKMIEMIWPEAGVLINKAGVEKNKKLLKDATSKGASLLNGDIDTASPSAYRMNPIVVSGVTKDMDLYYTESFGPTVSLIEFETEEEALKLANDTEYGLSSSVFTSDLRRGLRIAKEIESGACHINGMTVHDETALPHGGMKSSGYGRFGSTGMEEWLRTKTVTFKN